MRFTIAVVLCALIAACSGPSSAPVPASGPAGGVVSANRTLVHARVLGVRALGAQRFALRLAVEQARAEGGLAGVAAPGETLEAFPNFVRVEGQAVDYEADTNARLLRAGALTEGDRITAVLENQGTSWLLHDWAPIR